MLHRVRYNYARSFSHAIWRIVAGEHHLLLIETRDPAQQTACFSVFQHAENQLIWNELAPDEPWWISAVGYAADTVLFTHYQDKENPQKKGLIAYGLNEKKMKWWDNDFSFSAMTNSRVRGVRSADLREVTLDIASGKKMDWDEAEKILGSAIVLPHLYQEGTEYFQTVQHFLVREFNFSPVDSLEYLAHSGLIIISFYRKDANLSNELIVTNESGSLLLKEKIGEQLKGIGRETFFVMNGCLFFVKNNKELVSYTLL